MSAGGPSSEIDPLPYLLAMQWQWEQVAGLVRWGGGSLRLGDHAAGQLSHLDVLIRRARHPGYPARPHPDTQETR